MNKRITKLVYLLAVTFLLLLVGCSISANADGKKEDENNSSKTVWEKSENGYLEKVVFGNGNEDGVLKKNLGYSIVEVASGKGLAFGIIKTESNKNVIYKGVIMAKRTTEAFPHLFWNQYEISCGQSTVSMSNVISGPDEEDDCYEFMIIEGLTEYQLTELKNANQIVISLKNKDSPERNTAFACDYNFILNLIKYF